jgi:hypothetical protein
MVSEQPNGAEVEVRKDLGSHADFTLRLALVSCGRSGRLAMEHEAFLIVHAESF